MWCSIIYHIAARYARVDFKAGRGPATASLMPMIPTAVVLLDVLLRCTMARASYLIVVNLRNVYFSGNWDVRQECYYARHDLGVS